MIYPMFPMFPVMMGFSDNLTRLSSKPITIYALLQSICNFENDIEIKSKDLAKIGRSKIFDFDYPLSNKVSKEDFECMILNHFMMRRIGYDTVTPFKIALNVKINEIMPVYNKMFDMLEDWNIFDDGGTIRETFEKEFNEGKSSELKNTGTETMVNTGTDTMVNTGTDTIVNTGTDTMVNTGTDTNVQTGSKTYDKRSSDMPQSEIQNVQDADYLTNYNLESETYNNLQNQETLNTQNQETLNTQNQETLNTQNQRSLNTQNQKTLNTKKENSESRDNQENYTKNIDKTPDNKLELYQKFIENRNHIYSMIFKDLEVLFYGLV